MIAAEPYEPGATGVNGGRGLSPGAGGISRWPVISDRSMPASGNSVASDSTMPLEAVDRRDHVLAAQRGRLHHRGGAGELHDGDAHRARQVGDEGLRRLL